MKKLFLTAVCALVLTPAFAQTTTVEEKVEYNSNKHKVETNSFWDNWFISAAGGGQVYFGDHDKQCDFVDRIAPAVDIAVGKWFSPSIGVRVMYSGLSQKGATQNGMYTTGEGVSGKEGHGYWLTHQKFDFCNIHVDAMFNLCNIIAGYKPNRVWNCSPYLGIGWAHVFDKDGAAEASANIGLLNTFRLSDPLDLNLDIRGMYVNDRFDGEGGGRFGEGMWAVTLGLTYKFKERGWDRSKYVTRNIVSYDNNAINEMRRQLETMSAENERLKKAIAEGNKKEERVIVKKMAAAANLVTFKIDNTELSNEARANLSLLAEIIKESDNDVVYVITGFADKGTGNTERNEYLSRTRAENVYKCLVDEFGVSEKQLRIDYKGGVDNMYYDDPRLSRAAITRAVSVVE
ncbi:MAG: OmpA family protein [Muribaculaceae bacterium]|nr:OmpA family protein [Muribaculaceae bacterium]